MIALVSILLSGKGPTDPSSAVVEINYYGRRSITASKGFFVDTNGLVATALHVITGSSPDDYPDSVIAITSSGEKCRVKSVLGFNIRMDLCLLNVDYRNRDYLPTADRVIPGDSVLVLGERPIKAVVSIWEDGQGHKWGYLNAELEPGYSGSPVLDFKGNVIGVASREHQFPLCYYLSDLLSARSATGFTLKEVQDTFAKTPYGLVNFASTAANFFHDTTKTLDYLRAAVSMNPPVADVHYNLGSLFYQQGKVEESEREYREAIMIDLNHLNAHVNLGFLLVDQIRLSEAEWEFREAIRINPDLGETHAMLGILLYWQDKYSESEKELREAIRINPDIADVCYWWLGLLFDKQGNYTQAEREFREAIRINPNHADAHFDLGFLLLEQGRTDEGDYEIMRAMEIYKATGVFDAWWKILKEEGVLKE